MKSKQVNYAYQSSDIAQRYEGYHSGCWTVEIGEGSYSPWPVEIVSVHHTELEAINTAHKIELPWSQCWLTCQKRHIAAYSTPLLARSDAGYRI